MIQTLWNSPTLMTWGNLLVRALGLTLLLPLVLKQLPEGDIVIWYLFGSLMTIQMLVDMGFLQTFTRIIAYCMGGASVVDLQNIRDRNRTKPLSEEPNWIAIHCIERVMLRFYSRIAAAAFLVGATIGSWALSGPIDAASSTTGSWTAWGIVLVTSCWLLFGNYFSAYLMGLNQIAMVQRWQMLSSFFATALASITLMLGGSLISLVAVYQLSQGMNVVINIYLKRRKAKTIYYTTVSPDDIHAVWGVVWPVAWRSGIGVLISVGLVQLSGIIYAQLGETKAVISYLLGLQLIRAISSFSQAPFYSRIPVFSTLFAAQRYGDIIRQAKRSMRVSYAVFTTGFIFIGYFSNGLLTLINSPVDFPTPLMWSLLGIGFFFERYGAMHIQLYTVTNHVIWHIINSVTGLIMVLLSLALYPLLDVYAFPVALLGGYLGFYSWITSWHSYREFHQGFFSFEKSVMLPWLTAIIAGCLLLNRAWFI
jgi:hypothetical protein